MAGRAGSPRLPTSTSIAGTGARGLQRAPARRRALPCRKRVGEERVPLRLPAPARFDRAYARQSRGAARRYLRDRNSFYGEPAAPRPRASHAQGGAASPTAVLRPPVPMLRRGARRFAGVTARIAAESSSSLAIARDEHERSDLCERIPQRAAIVVVGEANRQSRQRGAVPGPRASATSGGGSARASRWPITRDPRPPEAPVTATTGRSGAPLPRRALGPPVG